MPGPLALDVAVPDEGDMHRHGAVTTDQQKERYGVPSPQVTSELASRSTADRRLLGARLGDLGMRRQMIADNEIDRH
ncbi:hypothetical protein EEB14_53460 [Rhodococcus sp. WS4]|nr:hypothetical protein EEB14_53460 [Rhodococcus sp. WS4]